MQYDFSKTRKRADEISAWLSGELSSLRTGRAAPAVLDKVLVEVYGSKMPLSHIGSISIEDARTLRISIWDKANVGPAQEAIERANLGISCAPDEGGIRVIFPELTEESRKKLSRVVGERAEESKISLRKMRDEVWSDIQKKEREGDITEDEKFRFKETLEKIIGEYNEKLETLRKKKESEVLGQ